MAALSSPGIGSGLNVTDLVKQLMEVERQPISALDIKAVTTQAQLSAYGSLKGALSSLQTGAKTLATSSTFETKKASVADSTIFSASADSTAAAGSFNIEVERLATAQKLSSPAFGTSEDVVGSGTLTFEFGTYTDLGGGSFSFSANEEKVTKSVAIEAGATVKEVAAAVNAAKIGVSATVVNDGTNTFLMFSPADPGAANALRITADDDDGNDTNASGLSQLAYDPTTGVTNLDETVAAQNALLHIDGVAITKSDNIITDAIQGVTLTLLKESDDGVTTSLSIANDTTGAKSAIETFVSFYNTLNKSLTELLAYDATTGKAGALQSEGTVRAIQAQMRSAMRTMVGSGAYGSLQNFSQLGITTEKDGSLKIDSRKLAATLADPTKDVQGFFVGSGDSKGLATRLKDLTSSMLATGGLLSSRTDGLISRIEDLAKRKTIIEKRLVQVEERYRAQFTRLDTLVASMTKTSSYLEQQLANLPKINSD